MASLAIVRSCFKELKAADEQRHGRDRLSALPDELLVHILSFLPTIEAIRIVVIRPFGNLWTLLPSINIFPEVVQSFDIYILNVVLLHKAALEEFVLHLDYSVKWDEEYVQMCLRSCLTREIKRLRIYVESSPNDLVIPMLNCKSLVYLELNYCTIERQCNLHMESLNKLVLRAVDFGKGAFDKMITGCPSLRELDIEVWTEQEICFTAPNIEKMVITVCKGLRKLCCPNLKYMELTVYETAEHLPKVIDISSVCEFVFRDYTVFDCIENLVHLEVRHFDGFFNYLRYLQVFRVSIEASKVLCTVMKRVYLPPNYWKRVDLDLKHLDQKICYGVYRLLFSCSKIEELHINFPEKKVMCNWCLSSDKNDCRVDFSRIGFPSGRCSGIFMTSLKTIKIQGFSRRLGCLIQFLEFLLKSALNLKILTIDFGSQERKHTLTSKEEIEFLKRLLSLRRESSDASIRFSC